MRMVKSKLRRLFSTNRNKNPINGLNDEFQQIEFVIEQCC